MAVIRIVALIVAAITVYVKIEKNMMFYGQQTKN